MPLKGTEYVGFGGFEFVDFDLIHRELGVDRMVSIECDSSGAARYNFNRPFCEIVMRFARASAALPDLLDEARPRIVWLDYESRLNHEVLEDVGTCLRRLSLGSVLIITVNAHPPRPRNTRRAQLVDDVGEERIPPEIDDAALGKWGLAATQYRILTGEVSLPLASRGDNAGFAQLFHFRYRDTAYMLTWGGAIYDVSQAQLWTDAFEGLEQLRTGNDPLLIEVPALTAKEAIYLNRQLPVAAATGLKAHGIPDEDRDAYAALYRWYPPVPAPI